MQFQAPGSSTLDLTKAKLENPLEIRPVYSNNVACMMSPNEIRLVFTEIYANELNKPPTLELRASVALSPLQAKALSQALSNTVSMFEAQFGVINWPPQAPKTH